jgi:DNA-binding response OmpR family regulator
MSAAPQIALIDDDRAWVEALAEYLHARGFSIHTAFDGLAGLSLLEQANIPVALVDQDMPGLTGLEMLRRIRQRQPWVAVLLVSGNDDPSLAARVRAEGGHAFLPKTGSPRLLLNAVRQALAHAQSAARRLDKPWNRLFTGPRVRRWLPYRPETASNS